MAIEDSSTTSISADVAELGEELEVQAPEIEQEEVEEVEEAQEEEVSDERESEPETEESEEEVEEEKAPDFNDHPFTRPSLKAIEEKFPGFFKSFPSLRDMYFREAEYSKLFPTVDDAREANENNEAFNSIKESIFQSDGTKLFSSIKETSDKDLEKFSSTVLPTLFKVHPQAFWRAVNPLVEDVARNMFEKGKREGNENLQNAARYLSDYFFGSVGVAEGKETRIIKVEDNQEVNKEREKFDTERATAFRSTIETDVRSNLVKLIEGRDPKTGKSKLDPDSVFSNFIRTTIVDKIIEELGTELTKDSTHIRYMDSLWNKAKQNGRTDADKARILSSYLARAKSLIPSLRSKYVSEALGQKTRVASKDKEKIERVSERRDSGTSGKGSNSSTKNYHPKSINYSKTSDADILNDNITYK
jgi:uncharacterized membrane-anchored protein YjiN (DUF445 family)